MNARECAARIMLTPRKAAEVVAAWVRSDFDDPRAVAVCEAAESLIEDGIAITVEEMARQLRTMPAMPGQSKASWWVWIDREWWQELIETAEGEL